MKLKSLFLKHKTVLIDLLLAVGGVFLIAAAVFYELGDVFSVFEASSSLDRKHLKSIGKYLLWLTLIATLVAGGFSVWAWLAG